MSLKRLIPILLALTLLSGCASSAGENPGAAALPSETMPQSSAVTLYDPNSGIEKETSGAVRAYPLGDGDYTCIIPMGENLMVVSAGGDITMLQGDAGEISATVATDLGLVWGINDLYAGKQSVGYYAVATREVVVLDAQLREAYRVQLPDDIQGKPLIQLNRGEVFYCTAEEIRAVNIQTGLSRLVRSHSCTSQELLGSYFEDTVISCLVVDDQGKQSVLYLDSETGLQLDEEPALEKLYTYGQDYFAHRADGTDLRILFGTRHADTMRLDIPAENVVPVLARGGAIRYEQTGSGLFLEYYDLSAGRITAQTTLSGVDAFSTIVSGEKYVWLLSGKTLYRWDPDLYPVEGSPVCTSQLFTRENPDADGLAACQSRAYTMMDTYSFTLEINEDAAKTAQRYGAESEFQTNAILQMMDEVESVLIMLPQDFLKITGNVRISLVRSLQSGEDRALYWANSTCHIILTPANTRDNLLWGLGNAVDTRVLGNSFDYDTWDDLNPWWFDYTYDYEKNLNRSNPEQFLEGSDRAFTDLVAMSFPTEDRSRIFANAMLPVNSEMFASDTMQKKLRCVCIAIREAYLWEDVPEVFPWEQYLKQPIAPSN